MQNVYLVISFVERENISAGKQHYDTEQNAENLNNQIKSKAFGFIGARDANQHIYYQHSATGEQAHTQGSALAAIQATPWRKNSGKEPVTHKVKHKIERPVSPFDRADVKQGNGFQIIISQQ